MILTRMTKLLTVVLASVISASAAQAQNAPKTKMTTDIPLGSASPDKVETRLGTLKFFDGFPEKPYRTPFMR